MKGPGEEGEAPGTPMMRQWRAFKEAFPDALLLFRLGDFYELFHEDAEIGARELGVALTGRDAGAEGRVPMCGIPHHALDTYLPRLIRRGYRVAICDQVGEPTGRGAVERRVTRVITPGSRIEAALLDERRATYLAALAPAGRPSSARLGLAFADVSTGEFLALSAPFAGPGADALWDELARRAPAELVLPQPWPVGDATDLVRRAEALGIPVTRRPAGEFEPEAAAQRLHRHFGVRTLAGFGVLDRSPEAAAAGGLLAYVEHTLQGPARQLTELRPYDPGDYLRLDEATKRNLEIDRSLDGREEGSLVWAVDRTVTAAGGRLLREWLLFPLRSRKAVEARHEAVAALAEDGVSRGRVRRLLSRSHDLGRLLARVAAGRAGPRDLDALRRTLAAAPEILAAGQAAFRGELLSAAPDLEPPSGLLAELEAALADDPPASLAEGGVIRDGFSPELDELRALRRGSRERLLALEERERERTGVRSLKVGYHRVFGYYIEVTRPNLASVPPDYVRRQTLAAAERFVTPELRELEERLLGAEEAERSLEAELFERLSASVLREIAALQRMARALALVDAVAALAELASERGYTRPELVDEPVFLAEDLRHPVVEAILGEGRYVPSPVAMDGMEARFLLVTGPNMAGKSTYARALALAVVLAQAGSFVPAKRARIGVADAVFSRIGARDDLARGESTFMREMVEVSRILRGATERSFVVVDEVGRGTSTWDGLAIAWAVAEELALRIRARTVFTTHYHELTALEGRIPGVRNLTMAVREDPASGTVEFLHSVVPGAADRSYGLNVALLAGVPRSVVARAAEVLEELAEDKAPGEAALADLAARAGDGAADGRAGDEAHGGRAARQLSLLPPALGPRAPHPLIQVLSELDPDRLSPRDALALLYEWRRRFGKRGG